jgi:hypothetical protein
MVIEFHSTTAPLVLNLSTGLVSPQYHLDFDDHFSTTDCLFTDNCPLPRQIYSRLFLRFI